MTKKVIKISVLAIIAVLSVACNCNVKTAERTTLIEEKPAADHPDWKVSEDTLRQDMVLHNGNKKYDIPFSLAWVKAEDTIAHRFYIAYYKLERTGGLDTVKIEKVDYKADVLNYEFPEGNLWVERVRVTVTVSFPAKGLSIKDLSFEFNSHDNFLLYND